MEGNVAIEPPTRTASFGWKSIGGITDLRHESNRFLLECGESSVCIVADRAGTIRVRLAPQGVFGRDHSWAVVEDDEPSGPTEVEEFDEWIDFVTESVRVRVQRDPCRISFHTLDDELICQDDPSKGMAWDGEEIACWKSLHAEDHFFGLGEKGMPFDKRGTALVNWNLDAANHGPWSDPLYQTHPIALVLNQGRAYGLFFDNTFRSWFDLGKTSRKAFAFGADAGELNYYFIPGPKPADVLRRYSRLVGAAPLPPRWSLGYQQCRWSYESAKRVRSVAKEFRRRKIPCDTIYIDIDYMDGFRCFTWDKKRFPNPRRLMQGLRRDGFRVVTILDPGIKSEKGYPIYDSGMKEDHFCSGGNGHPYVGRVWPGDTVYPDFTRNETRRWWGEQYRELAGVGVTGFWNDMNEPSDFSQPDGVCPLSLRHDNEGEPSDHRGIHNVYGMQMARATFEGVRRLRPDERPFVLTRAGYAGVQRYAAVWTGDNRSNWDYLRMSIPMLLNMSMSGLTFCGADIGGFFSVPTAELFTRWLQLGIFYPLCRAHTCGGPEQDPWGYGKKHEKLNRSAIELRYRLLPYLYTEFQFAVQSGLPLFRPLLIDYPDHPKVHECQFEFMFGRQLLVAPVVEKGATTRKVTLPDGDWFDFADGTPRTGGEEIEIPIDMASIPIFVRAGAVLPTKDVVQHVDEKPMLPLVLNVFPGAGGGSYYHDDGISYTHRDGDFVLEQYETTATKQSTTFRMVHRHGRAEHAPASYLLVFHGIQRSPQGVTAANVPLTRAKIPQAMGRCSTGWYYDKAERQVRVKMRELDSDADIELRARAGKLARR